MSEAALLSGKVAVLCFSSAGELDVMLPLLKIDGVEDFKIVAFKREILEKIRQDTFYRGLIEGRLVGRVIDRVSPNKLVRWLQFLANAWGAFWRYRGYDYFCVEFGHSGREKNVFLALLALTGRARKVLFYPHGHAVTPDGDFSSRRWLRTTALCMKRGARILKLGAPSARPSVLAIGYPILHPLWREFVASHVPQLYRDHVVILSRHTSVYYLLEHHREQMLADVVAVFDECFPGAKIVLRAHPREVFPGNTLQIGGRAVEVTYENTYTVVRGARLAVSFWTSAFFQCQALGVPVVEFHMRHERFDELYPGGSLNVEFVPRFETRLELLEYCQTLTRQARDVE